MLNTPLEKYPKVELHVHLDTSLSYEALSTMCPGLTLQQYLEKYVAPSRCRSLREFLNYVDAGLEVLQTEKNLRLALRDLLRQWKKDNVIYAEVRLCPYLHSKGELSVDDVAAVLCDELALMRKDDPSIHVFLIFATLRHFTEEQSLEIASLAARYAPKGVVGFDLAGDEAGYPLCPHVSAFELARSHGLGITVHAGEALGPESVSEVLDKVQPDRIGHGVRASENLALVHFLKDAGTHLEICVSSNIQTGIYTDASTHPIDFLLREGLSLSFNTDGRGLTQTCLAEEFGIIQHAFGWQKEELYQCQLYAMEAAFCEDQLSNILIKQLEQAYAPIGL